MKKYLIIVIPFIFIILVTMFFCSLNEEGKTEKLFSFNQSEILKKNLIKVSPVQVQSFNTYTDEYGTKYDPYYLFDKNEITGWVGYKDKDYGRISILYFEDLERDFNLTHLKIKSGIQNGNTSYKDYSRPKKMELHFYKLIDEEYPEQGNNEYSTEDNEIIFESSVEDISEIEDEIIKEEIYSDEIISEDNIKVDDFSNNNNQDDGEISDIEIVEDSVNEDSDDRNEEEDVQDDQSMKVEIVEKIEFMLADEKNWQILKIPELKFNFDFVNIYIKDVFDGEKNSDLIAISEIEFLITDHSGSIDNDKFDYLYNKLRTWFESNDKIEFLKGKSTEIFYPQYQLTYKTSNLDEWYRQSVKSNRVFRIVVPTFEKAAQMVDFGSVPKNQLDYINSLHRYFDSVKVYALKYASYRWKKYRDTFLIYLENEESSYDDLEQSPIFFPFMKYLGTTFYQPKFKKRIKDASSVLNYTLRSFFGNNDNIDHFFLVRNHDNKTDGDIKYVLYYNNERLDSTKNQRITCSMNDVDPVCICIYDKQERLVKVMHREYGKEEHYFIIWDKNNKIEKILTMEIGSFGLKRIQKTLAKKIN